MELYQGEIKMYYNQKWYKQVLNVTSSKNNVKSNCPFLRYRQVFDLMCQHKSFLILIWFWIYTHNIMKSFLDGILYLVCFVSNNIYLQSKTFKCDE